MLIELAITASGILPFYLGMIAVLTGQYQQAFPRLLGLFFAAGLTTLPFFVIKYAGVDQNVFVSIFGPILAIAVLAFLEELIKSTALFFNNGISYCFKILVISPPDFFKCFIIYVHQFNSSFGNSSVGSKTYSLSSG